MQKNRFTFRSAFTMLELIFVIVILGIVASLGSQIVVQAYESYLVQRALHRASVKTELVATQIANRLAYAIPNTVIARQSNTVFTAIENAPSKDYDILEWIAYDADSFGYTATPGWSGFCDVRDPANTTTSISTPGSTLDLANTIIGNLSPSATTLANAAILFPQTYNSHNIGYVESSRNNANIFNLAASTSSTLNISSASGKLIKEHYKLAWTAYAIVPTKLNATQCTDRGLDCTDEIYDLALHYDYQPWEGTGESYSGGSDKILIRNVSVFNFLGTGDTIRIKLCVQESVAGTYPITMCKEKAVIR